MKIEYCLRYWFRVLIKLFFIIFNVYLFILFISTLKHVFIINAIQDLKKDKNKIFGMNRSIVILRHWVAMVVVHKREAFPWDRLNWGVHYRLPWLSVLIRDRCWEVLRTLAIKKTREKLREKKTENNYLQNKIR